jgi:hypothetical protein
MDTGELKQRLDSVFGRATHEAVAQRLKDGGFAVSAESVRRYRVGGSAKKIPADFLTAVARVYGVPLQQILSGTPAQEAVAEASVAELNGMERRLDEIDRQHPGDAHMRMLERETLAAVYRAEAMRVAERAAEIRASAIRDAEKASASRADAMRVAEPGAQIRALASTRDPLAPPSDAERARHAALSAELLRQQREAELAARQDQGSLPPRAAGSSG